MSTACPCCGQRLADLPLKVSMEFNTIICGYVALQVSPKQAEIAYVLRDHWPHNVHKERLIQKVWGRMSPEENTMRTMIYTTRKALETIGWTIRNSRTHGYRLDKIDAARL